MSTRLRALVACLFLFGALTVGATSQQGQSAAQTAPAARVTILGSVVDASLSPLVGVAVTLERDGKIAATTTSAADGTFKIANVAPGTYRLKAERLGFPALTRDVRVPSSVKTIQLPLVMSRAEDKLQAVDKQEGGGGLATTKAVAVPTPPSPPAPPPAQSTPPPATATAAGAGGAGGRGGGRASTVSGLPMNVTIDGAVSSESQYRQSGIVTDQFIYMPDRRPFPPSGETYPYFTPNRFTLTLDNPLSTFGADVDTASYANVRRYLTSGQLPPRQAVRVEEFVNYFRFAYADPRDGQPIGLTTEIGDCPWAPTHKLVLVGARAKAPATREITGRNIVLLIDVSGSMAPPERLPLIKTALGMFVDTLRPDDTLSIVTYAGTSGIALWPTPARHRDTIQNAIGALSAGGSTNGGSGLIMAYRVAREGFSPGGVNRVILATDGDFNVGITSQRDLYDLIERERESGVFLSVFGVGSGNLKDATMEMLADRGNGNYSYLDSLQEARRVLIREGDATLEAVAKDVKFQIEFNPQMVQAWKQLGYEDRALAAQDFNNDRKDAGEMGAGHTVTALYEVVPAGVRMSEGDDRATVDPLRYQQPAQPQPVRPQITVDQSHAGEWFTVKARYKLPESDTSSLIAVPVRAGGRVQQLPFAAAVAEFAILLRDAPRSAEQWDMLLRRVNSLEAPSIPAADRDGFRELVAMAAALARLR